MVELPSYASLADVAPGTIYGLLESGSEAVLNATYDRTSDRDRALVGVIDHALAVAAAGGRAADAPRPRWLSGLITRELREASTSNRFDEGFWRIRLLERLGIVELDADDAYVLATISGFGPNKTTKLRADPDLLERVLWRVFEVGDGGAVSLSYVDRSGLDTWRDTFVELTADGILDRTRVLSACLAALSRDRAAFRAGWHSATYLALEPTVHETAAFQADLRRLLGAAVPATVGFALRQLAAVQKAGLLDVEATVDALPPTTLVKAKGTAIAALNLARVAAVEFPGAAREVAQTALGHPNPDVQRAASALLADLGESDAVHAAAVDMAPSVRHDLGLGADVSLESESPRGQGLMPSTPPVSPSDLAERAAALLEDASDVGELEAVLAILATRRADDALAPLRERATAVVAGRQSIHTRDIWLPKEVGRLLLAVLGDPVPFDDPAHPAQRFVVRRMAEVRTSTAPLLATPDLVGGWVSPGAFVERLAQNPNPRHHDLIAALLRLHPDGRGEAAHTAGALPAAARFALEGVEPRRWLRRGRREGPAAWWIAAERSRGPYAATDAPQLSGEVLARTRHEDGHDHRSWSARFAVTTTHTSQPADDQPTELKAQISDLWGRGYTDWFLGDWIPTLAAIWPHDAEHFLALTCLQVLESPSWAETSHHVPNTLDALARHPGRLGTLAVATLAAGISGTRPDHRLHAVDAFVDLVVSGRIPVRDVAAVMARYAQVWPAIRWAETLALVARAPGGATTTVDLLTQLLPQLPTDHRGLNKLLDLLRDELVRLGHTVADPALTTWLSTFSGSSASARAARLLLG